MCPHSPIDGRRKTWITAKTTATAAALPALFLLAPLSVQSANIAPEGTGIFGFNDAVDGDEGEAYVHTGQNTGALNDNNPASRVDNWKGDNGGDGGLDISFAGIVWPGARTDSVTGLRMVFATFFDGGWFGPPRLAGLPAGGTLTEPYLTEPKVQTTTDGITWTDVAFTSNYMAAMNGHQIGGGSNPVNPSSKAVTFTLTTPVTAITGIRVIGENGGTADGGFLGVFEFEVEATNSDSDTDGMDDSWETANGLNTSLNDAALDPDGDGLTNLREFQLQTDPQNADTDGDGLTDGAEVNTHATDPRAPDTDADGLNDGTEVSTTLTNPKVADTDDEGLSDGAEVNTWFTNPLLADTDGDGYTDAVEVRLFSNPSINTSVPANIAPSGTAIMGTSTALEGGTDTPYSQQNAPQLINDANLTTRVDTFNRTDPCAYAGIVWATPRTVAVDRVELSLALFRDGGWFGPNNATPGFGGVLDAATHLTAPNVQVTLDGTTWTTVAASTNYLSLLDGVTIPDLGPIPLVRSAFRLETPQANILGIRLIGPEGGIASGGFIGVWELGVGDVSTSANPNIALLGTAIMGTSTDPAPGGVDTAYSQQGAPQLINDGQLSTNVDTFNRTDPYAYAGIIWPDTRTAAVDRLEVTFSIFGDGGWFGPNNSSSSGGALAHPADPPILTEPEVQTTTDGGATWTVAPHSSTYLAAMHGVPVPAGASPQIVFALNPPVSGINGIRLIGPEGGTGSSGFLGLREFAAYEVPAAAETNIARTATAVLGINDNPGDGDAGRAFAASGYHSHINDGNPASRVDTFDGPAGIDPVSHAALHWPAERPVTLTGLTLTMATFTDGGWFGPSLESPAPGGALSAPQYLVEPEIEIRDAATGLWTGVTASSDYLTVFNGHTIGGGANPNPSSATATFTFPAPLSGLTGVRVAGNSGGSASSGFIGVFEMTAAGTQASNVDTDGDGQSDAEEAIAGTDPANPRSVLAITAVTRTGSDCSVTWSTVPGRTYQLQRSSDMMAGTWADVGGPQTGPALPATTLSATAPLGATPPDRLFLRVMVIP